MNKVFLQVISVTVFSALFSGCVSAPHKAYDGPERTQAELATIKWTYTAANGYDGIVIRQVDSTKLARFTNSNRVNVLPGKHELHVVCRDSKYRDLADGKISIDVEAGKIYVLYGRHKIGFNAETTSGRKVDLIAPHSCYADIKVYESKK